MKLFIPFLFIIPSMTFAQKQKGIVTDNTGIEVAFGRVEFLFEKSSSFYNVDIYGFFEFHISDTIQKIVYHSPDNFHDTTKVECFIENDFEIKTQYPSGAIICGQTTKWTKEESKSKYKTYKNGIETTNLLDTLNRKQGRWIIIHKNDCGKELNLPWEVGYFKDDIKVGKWLKIDKNNLTVISIEEK